VVKTGKTPVLEGKEWRQLIDTIPADAARDLRDRALIATLTYGFARIGAALKMRVEDLQSKGSGWVIRLHEKGGKQHRGAARLHRCGRYCGRSEGGCCFEHRAATRRRSYPTSR
jgi:integrase